MQDITDRKRAEEQARSSERRFRDILEEMHLLAAILDVEGRIIFCNDYTLELTGWTREELLGKPFSETLCANVSSEQAAFAAAMASGDAPGGGELRVRTRGGESRVLSSTHTILRTTAARWPA